MLDQMNMVKIHKSTSQKPISYVIILSEEIK
jgi:hypothetical protein